MTKAQKTQLKREILKKTLDDTEYKRVSKIHHSAFHKWCEDNGIDNMKRVDTQKLYKELEKARLLEVE